MNYTEFLKKEIKYFPKILKKYLKRNFFPNYKKILKLLK